MGNRRGNNGKNRRASIGLEGWWAIGEVEEGNKDSPGRGTSLKEAQRFKTAWDMSSIKQVVTETSGRPRPRNSWVQAPFSSPKYGRASELGAPRGHLHSKASCVSQHFLGCTSSLRSIHCHVFLGNPKTIIASTLQISWLFFLLYWFCFPAKFSKRWQRWPLIFSRHIDDVNLSGKTVSLSH